MHGAQRICRFVQTAGGQPFAIGTDGNRANAAEIDLLSAVVRMQRLGIERAHLFPCRRFPLLDAADQVAAEEELALGMKSNGINVSRVPAIPARDCRRLMFHSRTTLSLPPLTSSVPSGLTLSDGSSPCERRCGESAWFRGGGSHQVIFPSHPPLMALRRL